MNNIITFSITHGEVLFHKWYDKIGMVVMGSISIYGLLSGPINVGGAMLFGLLFVGCFIFGKFSDKFARQIIIDDKNITFIMLRDNAKYSMPTKCLKHVQASWFIHFYVDNKNIWFDRVFDKYVVSQLSEITQVKWTYLGRSRAKQGY